MRHGTGPSDRNGKQLWPPFLSQPPPRCERGQIAACTGAIRPSVPRPPTRQPSACTNEKRPPESGPEFKEETKWRSCTVCRSVLASYG
ncbi:hypothetical protein [Azospirillum palustre]